MVRTELDPNLRSPIRPYGDASFLSLRDHFFAEGINPTQHTFEMGGGTIATGGGMMINEHPTVMTSQPEIFNRNEDEEIDDDSGMHGGGGYQFNPQYIENTDSMMNHRMEEDRKS